MTVRDSGKFLPCVHEFSSVCAFVAVRAQFAGVFVYLFDLHPEHFIFVPQQIPLCMIGTCKMGGFRAWKMGTGHVLVSASKTPGYEW